MLPVFPKFKLIDLEYQKTLLSCLETSERKICELAFANLIVWNKFDRGQFTYINKNLCILISPLNEEPYFLEPLGRNMPVETAEVCLKSAGRISRASDDFLSSLPKDKFAATELRNQFDYVYLRKDLAELKGKKYDGKRNHLKRFRAAHPDSQFIPLSSEAKNEALELFDRWFEIRKESKFYPRLAYTAQKDAIGSAFDNYEALKLMGGAIMIGGKLKGFILGSRLNKDTASAHFSYGDPSVNGISQALLFEACNKTFPDLTYVDLEQDLGIPGLRSAKLSYHPMKLEKKYEIAHLQAKE